MTGLPHIAVTMTSHNRRDTTLNCLQTLFAQQELAATFTVYLVDDGSTDNTAKAVTDRFPNIHVLAGTGTLFWCGGMALAMREADRHQCDFLLWLNDDVALAPNALAHLLACHAEAKTLAPAHPAIIVGALTDPATGAASYAGFNRTHFWHPSRIERALPRPGQLTPCDTMNGNCVLIPRPVVTAIGLVDAGLIHRYGDIDYGYRAARAGFPLFVAPNPVGTCPPNPARDLSRQTIPQRWSFLTAPKGVPLRPMFRFMWRHGGVVGLAAGLWSVLNLARRAIRDA